MLLLVLAVAAFAVVHVIPAIPRARNFWTARLGNAFGLTYGLLSFALLVAGIVALRFAGGGQVYEPPAWGRHGNFILTLAAFIFAGVFLFRGSWRNQVRYPMGVATLLWALGHMLANGEVRSLIFILGLTGAALLHVFLASRLVDWRPSDVRQGHNLLSVLFGIALYGVAAQLHGAVIGVPVISLAGP